VGGVTQTASFDILVPGGRLVSSVSQPDEALAREHHVQVKYFIIDVTRAKLEAVAGVLANGKTRILVGEVLPLDQIRLAHEMLAGKAHRQGKIVIGLVAE
jgi:NADPH:quinone reductase-like Zn-dependent oxidoreductase